MVPHKNPPPKGSLPPPMPTANGLVEYNPDANFTEAEMANVDGLLEDESLLVPEEPPAPSRRLPEAPVPGHIARYRRASQPSLPAVTPPASTTTERSTMRSMPSPAPRTTPPPPPSSRHAQQPYRPPSGARPLPLPAGARTRSLPPPRVLTPPRPGSSAIGRVALKTGTGK
jgi:hypothetical protein